MKGQIEIKIPGEIEPVIFKPYGEVYWDEDRHSYNIFGLEISPEMLYMIANGNLDQSYGAYSFKYKDNHDYEFTEYHGLKAKLQRLLEEPIEGFQGEEQLRNFIKQQFEDFLKKNEVS